MTGIIKSTLYTVGLSCLFGLAGNDVANAQYGPGYGYDDYEEPEVDYTAIENAAHRQALARPNGYKHATLASNSKDKVGVSLVLLFDVSGSIDTADYQAQIDSMAEAIESDDFRDAIMLHGSPGSIAICVADFGSDVSLRIPWVDIRKGDDNKLKALAKEIRNLKRRENGSTNQADVIDYARIAIQNCPWESDKRVVDLITDGKHNAGGSAEDVIRTARKQLTEEAGATLNALIIMDRTFGSDQEEWSRKHLRTQEDLEDKDGNIIKEGFVIVVATDQSPDNPGALIKYFKEMTRAFKAKLRMETTYLDLEHIDSLDPLDDGFNAPQHMQQPKMMLA